MIDKTEQQFNSLMTYTELKVKTVIKRSIEMSEKVLRKLFLGFISIHILHHAKKEPIYGLWMIDELKHHGYNISAGTLYPILNGMEKDGLLLSYEENVEGKIRKYYRSTVHGDDVLKETREKAYELFKEMKE